MNSERRSFENQVTRMARVAGHFKEFGWIWVVLATLFSMTLGVAKAYKNATIAFKNSEQVPMLEKRVDKLENMSEKVVGYLEDQKKDIREIRNAVLSRHRD